MKPVPSTLLSFLVVALCVLCAYQWTRESRLRELYALKEAALNDKIVEHDKLTVQMKAADAEILRIQQALSEVKANSVSKALHEELTAQNTQLTENVVKQNATILQQNETLTLAAANIEQANVSIKMLTAQRDELAKRVNGLIEEMNARAKKAQ